MIAAINKPADIAASQTATACTTATTCATCSCSSREETERRDLWARFAAAALGALIEQNERHLAKYGHAEGCDEVARDACGYANAVMRLIDDGSAK